MFRISPWGAQQLSAWREDAFGRLSVARQGNIFENFGTLSPSPDADF
jgi:hypothetical protein